MKNKLNGYAKTAGIVLILLGVLWNAAVSTTILKNDLKHLSQDVKEIKNDNKRDHEKIFEELKELWRKTDTVADED